MHMSDNGREASARVACKDYKDADDMHIAILRVADLIREGYKLHQFHGCHGDGFEFRLTK